MRYIKYTAFIVAAFVAIQACKTNKTTTTKKESNYKPTTVLLHDKPLDSLKYYVEGKRWQMLYSIGGLTGSDRNNFEELYYTFAADGKMIFEEKGDKIEKKYSWEKQRDIYSGDSTYVLFTGLAGWIVNGIYNDTLKMMDNHPDGYSYVLIKSD